VIDVWENYEVTRYLTTGRPLTRSLDLGEEGLAMQATRTCSVTDCNRPHHGRGFCLKHYFRQYKPGTARIYPERGACAVEDCGRPHHARGWCNTHHNRWLHTGSPLVVRPAGCTTLGPDHPSWQGSNISYTGAHLRVRSARGSAAQHSCVDCGETAAQWSYDHLDPDEIVGDGARPSAYSAKPEHYHPRCIPCHAAFDKARRDASLASDPDGPRSRLSASLAAQNGQLVRTDTPEPLEAK
jgi:hypothetical protein